MMRNQTIYTILRNSGFTEEAAYAMMGNWACESGLEPWRLQNDFGPFRTTSKNYVARATSGAMSKEEFCRAVGFGLAQWTLPYRKGKLWEFWKYYGTALDSEIMQTFFCVQELKTEGEYAGLFRMLKESTNLHACCDAICESYERPEVNNYKDRRDAADRLQRELSGFVVDPAAFVEYTPAQEADPHPSELTTPAVMPTHEFWPPRVVCAGMTGPDIKVLHTLLEVWGYGTMDAKYDFGSYLETRVKEFQTDHGLKPDGIVGPLTWAALLKITKT